ncbi:protein kinase domain-containing protein [Marinicellulosiphila megalodicopiae]|uniref:protein kinase domain-containing protein n=1 Tax=Marinicellulosiphila megalodicopiae TaxID=2724896 RepID=UPI003BB1BD3D
MTKQLLIQTGQATDAGRKKINQDYIGVNLPNDLLVNNKGIAIAIADGISSSQVSQVASQAAVNGFLEDYFCTSDAWSVKTSGIKVLSALNSWLFSQTQNSPHRFNKDKGYVCTFSALVLKSNTAHIFHCGDSRIYQLSGQQTKSPKLEQLTMDHRTIISSTESYLARALGVQQQLDFDYQSVQLNVGDYYILTTDGIYEFVSEQFIIEQIHKHHHDLDQAANSILKQAYANDSGDNLSIQIVKIIALPDLDLEEISQQILSLPIAPSLSPRMEFDGYLIQREIYISSRSHVYLAQDIESKKQYVIKTPSVELCKDTAYLESFLTEDWIAKRIDNAHVLKAPNSIRPKNFMYLACEYIEGKSLSQWMRDNPNPSIEKVRDIVNQVAKGLQAFHRQEMVHQDLRPNNIMIDQQGLVKIIDFGSTKVAGILETKNMKEDNRIQGTALFSAPEYFIGYGGDSRSDLFSLAVITYHLLSGKLPYDTKVSRCTNKKDLQKLQYQTLQHFDELGVAPWVDEAIKKGCHPEPLKRYQEVSEFIYDLHHPNKDFLRKTRPALIERNPVAFWQGVSAILLGVVVFLLAR